jgi:hypothetical protein
MVMRRDTLEETIKKCRLKAGGYREHLLKVTYARMGKKVTEAQLMVGIPASNFGPAAHYDGPPTNIFGQYQAGVVQCHLREDTLCYRLIIGRGWLMLVAREDEAKWLPYSVQYWANRKGRKEKGETITGDKWTTLS